VLGTVLVLVVYGLGARLFNRPTGLAAAFVAAIAPSKCITAGSSHVHLGRVGRRACGPAFLVVRITGGQSSARRSGGEPAQAPAQAPTQAPVEARYRLWLRKTPVCICCRFPANCWCCLGSGLLTHYAFPLMIGLLSLLYLAWLIVTRRRGLISWRVFALESPAYPGARPVAPWLATAGPPASLLAAFGGRRQPVGANPSAAGDSDSWFSGD